MKRITDLKLMVGKTVKTAKYNDLIDHNGEFRDGQCIEIEFMDNTFVEIEAFPQRDGGANVWVKKD